MKSDVYIIWYNYMIIWLLCICHFEMFRYFRCCQQPVCMHSCRLNEVEAQSINFISTSACDAINHSTFRFQTHRLTQFLTLDRKCYVSIAFKLKPPTSVTSLIWPQFCRDYVVIVIKHNFLILRSCWVTHFNHVATVENHLDWVQCCLKGKKITKLINHMNEVNEMKIVVIKIVGINMLQ